ncbi:MAG: metallophosphoesterase [Candidatus Saganbacteria bacterium]|nr:metallophosphoesterase [Candidatus Saganbacteria bacterium]
MSWANNFLPLIISLLLLGQCCFGLSSPPEITSEVDPTSHTFSFAVFGDNRDGDDIFVDLIKKVNQDDSIAFCLSTGDFVSRGQESEYQKYLNTIKNLNVKVYHTPGNHDMVKYGYKYFKKYFGPYHYSFDYQNSHFIVLNNAFGESFTAEQFNWLKKDLANAKSKNIFVFMHRPTFDPTEIYAGYVMSGKKTVEELMYLFGKYGVDYVFAGHLHGYARAKRDGVVYVVTAGGGAPLYLPRAFGGFYHYVKITVDKNKIRDEVVMLYE